MKWFRKLQGIQQLRWGVLGVLIFVAVISLGLSFFDSNVTWGGLLQNFGTEMAGAVVTYLLLEIVLGTRQKKENLTIQITL